MASHAIGRVVGFEGPGAVMAFSAELAGMNIRHLHLGRSLFHSEYLRVAVQAFEPLIGMHLAVEGHLAHGRIPLGALPRRDRPG